MRFITKHKTICKRIYVMYYLMFRWIFITKSINNVFLTKIIKNIKISSTYTYIPT